MPFFITQPTQHQSTQSIVGLKITNTRKLSYRKDDRAMRPIYGCPENFRESPSMPMATFPEIFNGILFRLILGMCVQNLKFEAFPIPDIMGVLKKTRAKQRCWANCPCN